MVTQTDEGNFLGVDLSPENGVEKIIAMKTVNESTGTHHYYQIQWHPTWVLEQSLTKYCSHLIQEYVTSKNKQNDLASNDKNTSIDTASTNISHKGSVCNGVVVSSCGSSISNDVIEAFPAKTVSNLEPLPAVTLIMEAPLKQNEIEATGVRKRKTRMPLKAETKSQVSPLVEKTSQCLDVPDHQIKHGDSTNCGLQKNRENLNEKDGGECVGVADREASVVEDPDDGEYVPDLSYDDEGNALDEMEEVKLKRRKSRKVTDTGNKHTKKSKKETTNQSSRKTDGPLTCEKCGCEYTKNKCPPCSLATCKGCGIKYNNSYYKEKCRACTNKCKQCGQSFRKPSDLVKHTEAIHERIKKYHCTVCSKGFAAKQYLTAHMESHKVEANHVCPICNKKYKTGRRLNRHKKTHTGEKPYSCPVCQRTFLQKIALKTHMLTHSDGPRRFQCLLCKKGFNHKVSLKSHMLKHHDKNEQQAAVMIGLWKKYQKDEACAINMQNNQDEVLTRALSAVAMTPLDNEQNVCPTNPTFPFIDFGQI